MRRLLSERDKDFWALSLENKIESGFADADHRRLLNKFQNAGQDDNGYFHVDLTEKESGMLLTLVEDFVGDPSWAPAEEESSVFKMQQVGVRARHQWGERSTPYPSAIAELSE